MSIPVDAPGDVPWSIPDSSSGRCLQMDIASSANHFSTHLTASAPGSETNSQMMSSKPSNAIIIDTSKSRKRKWNDSTATKTEKTFKYIISPSSKEVTTVHVNSTSIPFCSKSVSCSGELASKISNDTDICDRNVSQTHPLIEQIDNSSVSDLKENNILYNVMRQHINYSSRVFQMKLAMFIEKVSQQNGRTLPKTQLCMLQLCILMHAGYCRKSVCTLLQCSLIKPVMDHMASCNNEKCEVAHCRASKQLLKHWKDCRNDDCSCCRPILEIGKSLTNQQQMCSFMTNDDRNSRNNLNTTSELINRVYVKKELVTTDDTTPDASPSIDALSTRHDLISLVATNIVDKPTVVVVNQVPLPLPLSPKVWTSFELNDVFKPLLDLLWKFGRESIPFQKPVDPVKDMCPDYLKIIKNPMDLSLIKRKLNQSIYKEPWQFINDVYLMFKNAWTYNQRKSKFFGYASKLASVFESRIDGVMRSIGYCCGRYREFNVLILYCQSVNTCSIRPYCFYYSTDENNKYMVCENCFLRSDDFVTILDDRTQTSIMIHKTNFTRKKNVVQPLEELIGCVRCGRLYHVICVMYLREFWPLGYICKSCSTLYSIKHIQNKFSAKDLSLTNLSSFIENRINFFFKKHELNSVKVYVRVLSSANKFTDILPRFKKRFPDAARSIPYVGKAIFAFQEVNGIEVCFFGMHVQEYGVNTSGPNCRCVYLAYMDSVNYFTPHQHKTAVYQEILMGYMDYVKSQGFLKLFIWSCPPSAGDDYIFYCHPMEQKIPKPKRLEDWYRRLLEKAAKERIIISYKDVLTFAIESNMKSASEMPYFGGDYWSSALEDMIKELDVQSGVENNDDQMPNKPKRKKGLKCKSTKAPRGINAISSNGHDALTQKLFTAMKKYREMYFVIYLNHPKALSAIHPKDDDMDFIIPNDLMMSRSTFLLFSRSQHFEFSTLRRAKFSTLALLLELERRSNPRFICDNCSVSIQNCDGLFACTECKHFYLCIVCYEFFGHEHEMKQKHQIVQLDKRPTVMSVLTSNLEHAVSCHDDTCLVQWPYCSKFKSSIKHMENCSLIKSDKPCHTCHQLLYVVLSHARFCEMENCNIVHCERAKEKRKDLLRQQRQHDERTMRSRMQLMEEDEEDVATTTMQHSNEDGFVSAKNDNDYENNNDDNDSSKGKGSFVSKTSSSSSTNVIS